MKTLNLLEGLKFQGQLEITGDVFISDPCYDLDTWCTESIELPLGMYDCYTKESEGRVAEMWIIQKHTADVFLRIGQELGQCGVDSGQLGIFNKARFNKDVTEEDLKKSQDNDFPYEDWVRNFEESDDEKERFYKVCCNHTLNHNKCGIINGVGFVTSSGWGDGSYYPDEVIDKEGNVIGLRIIFISDAESEEE